MTQFEKEKNYVISVFQKVITPDDLGTAKRLKRDFIDKYVVLISQTDKTFIRVCDELNKLEQEKTTLISSAYLFGKK